MKEIKVIRKRKIGRVTSFERQHSSRRQMTTRVPRYNSKHSLGLLPTTILICSVLIVISVCAVCLRFISISQSYKSREVSAVVEPCVIENGENTNLNIEAGDIHILTVPIKSRNVETVQFESSDESILTVDSGGRIDALKEGQAVITANGKDFSGTCTVTIQKSSKASQPAEYTTAYTANLDILEKNKEDGSKNPYSVTINRRTNTVTVYTYDDKGDYVVPVRAMVCSCGEMTDENITPTGEYSVYFKNYWHALFGDVYGKYVTGFSGHYLFHSVPYTKTESYTLKTDEFNKLGTNASQGCVRLMIADAKWIYDNLDMFTEVKVIDASGKQDPLGTPPTIKTDTSVSWDPTDPHKKNPYKDKFPVISGAKDITIKKGDKFSMNVTAVDSCSNDISDSIEVMGNVITSKEGTYKVTYSVTDLIGKTAETTITVTVE